MMAIAYNGVTAIIPATILVLTKYSMGRMAMDSSASISSLMRMAPSCAVTPAPNVAAKPIPATTGATRRTLRNADKNPVNASMPISPSELYPWTASVPPDANVKNPTITTVPPISAKVPAPILISATRRTISRR
jgi:hypothetical protein